MHTADLKAKSPKSLLFLPDEKATLTFGSDLAVRLQPGMVIHLSGELGAGKTTLARGILRGLGYEGRVKSPTFTLVEVYKFSKIYFYHFDFYRFDHERDLDDSGFREYFSSDAVCLIEWPEKVSGMPAADIHLVLSVSGTGRTIHLESKTEIGARCLEALIAH